MPTPIRSRAYAGRRTAGARVRSAAAERDWVMARLREKPVSFKGDELLLSSLADLVDSRSRSSCDELKRSRLWQRVKRPRLPGGVLEARRPRGGRRREGLEARSPEAPAATAFRTAGAPPSTIS